MRVVAIIIKEGKILLLRRIREGDEYFVFPGGSVEDNESLEEAIRRELKEELGVNIVLENLAFQLKNRGEEEYYFLVKELSGRPKWIGKGPEEFSENNQFHPLWFELKEAINLKNLFPEEAKKKLHFFIYENPQFHL